MNDLMVKKLRRFDIIRYFNNSMDTKEEFSYGNKELCDMVLELFSDKYKEDIKYRLIKNWISLYFNESTLHRTDRSFRECMEELICLLELTEGEEIMPENYQFGMAGYLKDIEEEPVRKESGDWCFPDREEYEILRHYNSRLEGNTDFYDHQEMFNSKNLSTIKWCIENRLTGDAKGLVDNYIFSTENVEELSVQDCMHSIYEYKLYAYFNRNGMNERYRINIIGPNSLEKTSVFNMIVGENFLEYTDDLDDKKIEVIGHPAYGGKAFAMDKYNDDLYECEELSDEIIPKMVEDKEVKNILIKCSRYYITIHDHTEYLIKPIVNYIPITDDGYDIECRSNTLNMLDPESSEIVIMTIDCLACKDMERQEDLLKYIGASCQLSNEDRFFFVLTYTERFMDLKETKRNIEKKLKSYGIQNPRVYLPEVDEKMRKHASHGDEDFAVYKRELLKGNTYTKLREDIDKYMTKQEREKKGMSFAVKLIPLDFVERS